MKTGITYDKVRVVHFAGAELSHKDLGQLLTVRGSSIVEVWPNVGSKKTEVLDRVQRLSIKIRELEDLRGSIVSDTSWLV